MTNRTKVGTVVLLLAMLAAWTATASAYPFGGACGTELNAVGSAIQDGAFVGKKGAADQSNLLAKLEAAAAKVQLGKFDDAVDKLLDISDTATALADAPKPKLEDAGEINTAVIAAIACVGGL